MYFCLLAYVIHATVSRQQSGGSLVELNFENLNQFLNFQVKFWLLLA